MSCVTNVIVSICSTAYVDPPETWWPLVNAFFCEAPGLVSIHDPKLPEGWYGGTRSFEATIAIGAFNHFDLCGFVAHLKSVVWDRPASVQVIYQGQNDIKFSVIDVIDEGWND